MQLQQVCASTRMCVHVCVCVCVCVHMNMGMYFRTYISEEYMLEATLIIKAYDIQFFI